MGPPLSSRGGGDSRRGPFGPPGVDNPIKWFSFKQKRKFVVHPSSPPLSRGGAEGGGVFSTLEMVLNKAIC